MNKAFLDHFKISEDEVLKFKTQDGLTFLEHLLLTHSISEKDYLEWAKSYYHLPVLKDGFLEKENHIETLSSRYKNIFPKNIIPFYEWDGVLYLLCLEPKEIHSPQKTQFILAPFSLMQKWSTAPALSTRTSQNEFFLDLQISSESSDPSDPLEFNSPSPDGLSNFNLNTAELLEQTDFQSPSDDHSEAVTSILNHSSNEMPEGLNFPSLPNETQPPVYAVEDDVKSSDLNLYNESPNIKAIPSEEKNEDLSESTHTGVIIQNSGAIGIINSMKKYFDQVMILIYENENLKALKWDSGWTKLPHAQNSIDLKSASIFRIVFDTHYPYHGHVIPNPINDSFFQAWNKGVYPEHITLVPVLQNKSLVGMLLGTCSKQAANKFQLRNIENLASTCLNEVLLPQIQKAS